MLCPRARQHTALEAERLASAVPSWAYPVTGNKSGWQCCVRTSWGPRSTLEKSAGQWESPSSTNDKIERRLRARGAIAHGPGYSIPPSWSLLEYTKIIGNMNLGPMSLFSQ